MARLNTRPSTRYGSETPAPDSTLDQENRDPSTHRMDNGKGKDRVTTTARAPSRASLLTPSSESGGEARGQKRKRVNTQATSVRAGGNEGQNHNEDEQEEQHFNRYFDPNQNPDERREVKRKSRALERQFHDNRDELLRDSGRALTNTVSKADDIYKGIKQTNDATLDSRLLVNVSDLAYKKTNQLVLGDASTGVDVDEFLSKCISYMRNGGPLERDQEEDGPSTSRRQRRSLGQEESDDEEEDDVIGATLDWELLGRHVCFPYNARPCVPSFLLGPLSVEKKQRSQTQRRSRQAKDNLGREARPEALSREDLSQSDENALTAICKGINLHLRKHIDRAEKALGDAGVESRDEFSTERGQALLKKVRLTDTGGPALFDYVVNPNSFGQTVENLFYVSFLIKEGTFGIQNDCQGMPTIIPSDPSSLEDQRRNKTSKHQAVFSIDYSTWERLIEAFEITEPLIAHRREDESGVTLRQRGWYN